MTWPSISAAAGPTTRTPSTFFPCESLQILRIGGLASKKWQQVRSLSSFVGALEGRGKVSICQRGLVFRCCEEPLCLDVHLSGQVAGLSGPGTPCMGNCQCVAIVFFRGQPL